MKDNKDFSPVLIKLAFEKDLWLKKQLECNVNASSACEEPAMETQITT